MSGFSDITVVSVTGWQPAAAGAALSVQLSAHELPGSRALLISPERPALLPPWVRHVPVRPFGYMEYSVFMLYALHQFIDTDYALVVQDDGWVVSGRHWRQAYFDCDYIGAPVHLARVRQKSGAARFVGGFGWCAEALKPDVLIEPVFNGGFSLRSQRLMRAPRALGLSLEIPPPLACDVSDPAMQLQWENDVVLEDVWLCIGARAVSRVANLTPCASSAARGFAIEHASPLLHDGYPLQTIVGHHSKFRKIVSIGGEMPTLRYTIPRAASDSIFGEHAIQRMFRSHGWRIQWPGGMPGARGLS
jgi:hypothetical protein